MSFLETREIGRKWKKEVMTEEEDYEEVVTYIMGVSITASDKDSIDILERQVDRTMN